MTRPLIKFDEISFDLAKEKVLPLLDATNSNDLCAISKRYSTTLTYSNFGRYMLVLLKHPEVRALITKLSV